MDRSVLKIICLAFLVLALGIPSLAQNTKGDRPAPAPRDTRFKTPRKPSKKSKPPRRVSPENNRVGKRAGLPPARTPRGVERPGKPIGSIFSRSRPDGHQRAWKGDISGRRIRPRSSSARAHNVYPQPSTTNYSSRDLKRRMRFNDNPAVRRVRRMQEDDHGKPKVGKPIRPTFHKARPSERQRAWRGDITGRRIRAKHSDNVGRRTDRSFSRIGAARSRRSAPGRIAPRRYSSRAKNTFFGKSFYVNNRSRQRARIPASGNPSLSLNPARRQPKVGGGKITPRSASASFRRNRSLNAWAHFRKPQRPRLPFDRDLAGQKLRSKNYETRRPVLDNPTWRFQRRVPGGDRAYKGAAGGYDSRTRTGRAWRGDIAHRAVRGGKAPRGRESAFLGFLKGGGFRSATVPGDKRRGQPLRGRPPGIGAEGIGNFKGRIRANQRRGFGDQGEAYTGNIRARRQLKGGGSASGRWNNNGMPIQGRTPGKGSRGIGYAGNIRVGHRGFNDQGEEYSGNTKVSRRRGFGNQGEGYRGNIKGPRGFNDQGEEYTGNIKAGRRGFNDQGEAYRGNIKAGRRGFNDQGEEYTGNIRAHREARGGGSRTGHWNNNNAPIMVRTPKGSAARIAGYQGNIRAGGRGFNDQGEGYSGNIKAKRPDKGGGSVSGKVWNNDERPIAGRYYAGQTKISRYSGNLKARRPEKGGGSVSGELWNNRERPIPGKDYSYAKKHSRYTGHFKVTRPDKDGNGAFGFSGNARLARSNYKHNPRSDDEALRGRKASAATREADVAARGVRRSWDYIRNPSSAKEAQRTREPGRAFASLSGFQGHMKVQRFDLFGKRDLHPDAQFVKLNKNNVSGEKDMLTNLKLWWARLFKGNETQPDHLKEKPGKPRYDKGEAGMWYE